MIKTDNNMIYGGFRIYCGANEAVPSGKVRGTPNQCYKTGIKSGFRAGLDTGEKMAIKKAKIVRGINEIARQTAEQQIQDLTNNVYITKEQLIRDYDNGNALHQRPLQAIAKKLGLPRATATKLDLLPRLMAHNWTRVKAREVLFQN